MRIRLLKSKIHRATVTEANLDYYGSITIDQDLMDAVNLVENEMVIVANMANGTRHETYVIPRHEFHRLRHDRRGYRRQNLSRYPFLGSV